MSTTPESKRDRLQQTAVSFCEAFGSGVSGSECLDRFFIQSPSIIEHGPTFATKRLPFLATQFTGRKSSEHRGANTCEDYYDLLASSLALVPGSLKIPSPTDIAVDMERGIVTVRLHASFKSVKSGNAWEEDFVYVLSGFDEDGRIGRQELWADPLSAWLAVGDE